MIQDPGGQVLAASAAVGDDATLVDLELEEPALLGGLRLARRRFATALPPPFVPVPDRPADLPVRPAAPGDGPACAAVQRRAWRAHGRGLLPDAALDRLDLGRLGRDWVGRALDSPSPRHVLLVAGRPGEVHGVIDAGPARDPDEGTGTGEVAEVRSLHLDPTVVGHGLGAVLLAAALARLAQHGLDDVTLWVIEGNGPASRFYERHGWSPDGASRTTTVDGGSFVEVRYRNR